MYLSQNTKNIADITQFVPKIVTTNIRNPKKKKKSTRKNHVVAAIDCLKSVQVTMLSVLSVKVEINTTD